MSEHYPEARMIEPMKYWKLPSGKEGMLSEICEKGEYFSTLKIDGYWYMFEKTDNYSYLFSRNKSVTTGELSEKSANIPHIMRALECLPPNTILIGEIFYPNCTSKDVTKIMGCLPEEAIKRQKDNPIHYYLHDILMYDGVNLMSCGAEERYDILAAVWSKHQLASYDFLQLATKVTTDIEKDLSTILRNGGEGVVLKKKTAPYDPGKRPAWSSIKVKQMDSVDLVCMGFCSPTKEYTGKDLETWPYWLCKDIIAKDPDIGEEYVTDMITDICQYGNDGWIPITKYYYLGWNTAIEVGAYDKDGKLVKIGTVSSGLSDDDKRLITELPRNYLNTVVSLDCMSLDKKEKTLRHPVFKSWHDGKNPNDCKLEEIF